MKCDKCGKTIDNNALVCPFCEAELQSPTEEIEVLDFDTVVEEVKPSTVLDENKSSDDKKEDKKENKKEDKKKKDSKKPSTKKDKKEDSSKEKDKKTKKEEKDKKEENLEEKLEEEKREEKDSNKKEEETKKEDEQLLEKLDETQEEKIEDEVSELSEKEIDKKEEPNEETISEDEEKLDVTNFEGTFVELPEGLVEKINLPEEEEVAEDNKQPVIETEETIDLSSLDVQSVVDELVKDKVDAQEPQIISSKDITEEEKKEEQPELVMEPTIIAESIQDVSELPNQSVEVNEEEHTGSYEPFVDSENIVPLPPKKTLKYRIKDFYRSWFEGYEKAPEIKVDDRETRLTLEKIYERTTKEAQEKPISSADVGMVWLICFVIAFISFFVLTVLSFIVDIILGDANNTSLLTVIIPVFQIGIPSFFILFGWAIGIVYSYIKRKADRK